MNERPDIRIPRPPKGTTGQRPGVNQSWQGTPTPEPTPTVRPVTIGDIYRQIAKPDIDELLRTLQEMQKQLTRHQVIVGMSILLVILVTSSFTWFDLFRLRANQTPQIPPVEQRP